MSDSRSQTRMRESIMGILDDWRIGKKLYFKYFDDGVRKNLRSIRCTDLIL